MAVSSLSPLSPTPRPGTHQASADRVPQSLRHDGSMELDMPSLVSQVDDLDEPTFPCFNITSGLISRESFRSLLFSMLPDSAEGPVLPLLPAVDCRYQVKPVFPLNPLAVEVAPLSLSPLSQHPALIPCISFQASLQHQHSPTLTSPPVCTMPPPLQSVLTDKLPASLGRSPVAVVPLITPLCARLKMTPTLGLSSTPHSPSHSNTLSPPADSTPAATLDTPALLQLMPPSVNGQIGIQDLNDTPVYVLEHNNNNNKKDNLQVYVRRSPRIQKAYDGNHINSVDRASRRLAAATPSSSGGSSSSGSRRRGRTKARKIEVVAPLPIKARPRPTPKSKIKELAELCGIRAVDTFREAAISEKLTLSDVGSLPNE